MWWRFEAKCYEPVSCCSSGDRNGFCFGVSMEEMAEQSGQTNGVAKICGRYFDFCSHDALTNIQSEKCGSNYTGSCWDTRQCSIQTHDICEGRWLHPERCTMAVADALIPLLMAKLLFAAVVPLGLLLACRMAWRTIGHEPSGWARRSPVWFWAATDEEDDGARVVVRLRLRLSVFRSCSDKDIRLSDMFNAEQVVTRALIWTDLGIAWGPIMPLISLAALLVALTENWCFRVAREMYVCQKDIIGCVPRAFLLFGVFSSYTYCVCHLISGLELTTSNDVGVLLLSLVAGFVASGALFSWLSWLRLRCQRRTVQSSLLRRALHTAVEVPPVDVDHAGPEA